MARRKVTLSLDEDLMRRMKATCALLETNVSTVAEDLMRQWLELHEAAAREPRLTEKSAPGAKVIIERA